jgi:hypothetical protein
MSKVLEYELHHGLRQARGAFTSVNQGHIKHAKTPAARDLRKAQLMLAAAVRRLELACAKVLGGGR